MTDDFSSSSNFHSPSQPTLPGRAGFNCFCLELYVLKIHTYFFYFWGSCVIPVSDPAIFFSCAPLKKWRGRKVSTNRFSRSRFFIGVRVGNATGRVTNVIKIFVNFSRLTLQLTGIGSKMQMTAFLPVLFVTKPRADYHLITYLPDHQSLVCRLASPPFFFV